MEGLPTDTEALVKEATTISTRFMNVVESPTSSRRGSRKASEVGEQDRDLMEALGVAVYTTDAAGIITYYNQAAVELWGRRPEIGKDEWCGSWKIYHLDGTTIMPHGECPMAICLKENRPVRGVEAIAERPDGTRVYFQPFPTPLLDDTGKLVGAINVLVDITDRKLTEQALRESKSQLSVAMSAGQMGSWEWRIADNTVSWSEALEQIHGLQPGTFAGTLDAFLADVHPDERTSVQETISQSLESGTHEIEYRIIRPDGQLRWVLGRGQLVRDANGAPSRMVGVCMDITERKQAELAAVRLAAIVESSDDAIIGKDLDGLITSWNAGAERMYGYSADDAIGRSVRIIIPPDRQHEEDEVLSRIRNGEYVEHFQTMRRRKDGTEVYISLSVSPIRDRSGKIVGASKIARDISEVKRSEEALLKSMAVKDEFLGLVSHELRTPITTILGNALLLQRRADKLPEEYKREALRDVATEAERLQRIIENLLLLTRVDVAEPVETEPVRLQAIVAQSVDAFQRRKPQRSVSVTAEGNTPIILGQPAFIALALDNLISNADKYSPPDSPIEITIRRNGRWNVEVCVRDYGIGLDEEEVEQVFTPFYRSPLAAAQAKGIGLGLAVCKRVIEAQGGTIRAVARAEGGCDFIFTVKRYRDSGS
jgi:PAS domain S-box-containing protein